MRQAGLFGLSEHLKRLSAHGDPLEELGRIIDFEAFRPVLVAALGFWACGRELAGRPGADPSEVVIDEVAGQWIALLFPACAFWWRGWEGVMPYPGWVAAFAFFRLFDIWKPWLVGRADRRGDAAGVMLDDLWAGLFAGICSVILAGLYHGALQPWLNG